MQRPCALFDSVGEWEGLIFHLSSKRAEHCPFLVTDSSERPPRLSDIPEEEIAAMQLWVSGMRDRDVAHHLCLSLTTLRRRLLDFRRRMGARSRVEAAVIAASKGWLAPPGEDDRDS